MDKKIIGIIAIVAIIIIAIAGISISNSGPESFSVGGVSFNFPNGDHKIINISHIEEVDDNEFIKIGGDTNMTIGVTNASHFENQSTSENFTKTNINGLEVYKSNKLVYAFFPGDQIRLTDSSLEKSVLNSLHKCTNYVFIKDNQYFNVYIEKDLDEADIVLGEMLSSKE